MGSNLDIRRADDGAPDPVRRLQNIGTGSPVVRNFTDGRIGDADVLRDFGAARLGRDGSRRRSSAKPGERDGAKRSSRWRWWAIVDAVVLMLAVPAAVVTPPLLECRTRQTETGFYAGDSFEKCARRGIRARWDKLDSEIKMIVRGSGR